MERVSIPFDTIEMAGYLRVPPGAKKPPCVVLLGGLDTTKEDYLTIADYCLQRGLATLAFDGPGQGETLFEMRWRTDFEKAIFAVLDFLDGRPEIDQGRIGIIGRSMGGHYAPKAAALDKRIKALVAWGAMYHLRNLASVPKHTLDGFLFVSGSRTLQDAQDFYSSIDLSAYASRIVCPALVVHGGLDAITPLDNATSLIKDLKGEVETLIWDDSIHCCHDRAHIVRPAMADFMQRRLIAD
jgi:2,6-dihydroxypseudooxynicotine hydrolase